MSVEIKIPTINGMTLHTKNKYVKEDIALTIGIKRYDYSSEEDVIPNEDYINCLNNEFGNTYYAPLGAKQLPPYMFYLNKNIEHLVCSPTIKTIGSWCCREASNLQSVSLNEGLEVIDAYAFYRCNLEEIFIPNTVHTLGAYIFYGCLNLKKVNIPDGVSVIPNYCFSNCTTLETVEIPSSVVQLNNYCFHMCKTIKVLEIPSSVLRINDYVLVFGTEFAKGTVIMKSTTPPIITANSISTSTIDSIIVPKGCGDTYKTSTN